MACWFTSKTKVSILCLIQIGFGVMCLLIGCIQTILLSDEFSYTLFNGLWSGTLILVIGFLGYVTAVRLTNNHRNYCYYCLIYTCLIYSIFGFIMLVIFVIVQCSAVGQYMACIKCFTQIRYPNQTIHYGPSCLQKEQSLSGCTISRDLTLCLIAFEALEIFQTAYLCLFGYYAVKISSQVVLEDQVDTQQDQANVPEFDQLLQFSNLYTDDPPPRYDQLPTLTSPGENEYHSLSPIDPPPQYEQPEQILTPPGENCHVQQDVFRPHGQTQHSTCPIDPSPQYEQPELMLTHPGENCNVQQDVFRPHGQTQHSTCPIDPSPQYEQPELMLIHPGENCHVQQDVSLPHGQTKHSTCPIDPPPQYEQPEQILSPLDECCDGTERRVLY